MTLICQRQVLNSKYLLILDSTYWSIARSSFNNCGGQLYWWMKPEYPGENHSSATSHWQSLSHNVVLNTPRHERDSNSAIRRVIHIEMFVMESCLLTNDINLSETSIKFKILTHFRFHILEYCKKLQKYTFLKDKMTGWDQQSSSLEVCIKIEKLKQW
jgi:hypothetical protein